MNPNYSKATSLLNDAVESLRATYSNSEINPGNKRYAQVAVASILEAIGALSKTKSMGSAKPLKIKVTPDSLTDKSSKSSKAKSIVARKADNESISSTIAKINSAMDSAQSILVGSDTRKKKYLYSAISSLRDAKESLKTLGSIKFARIKTSLMPLHNARSSISEAQAELNRLPKDSDGVVNIALDDIKRSLAAAQTNLKYIMDREDEKRSKRANGLKY